MFQISDKKKQNIADVFFYGGILCELVVSFSGYAFGGYHEPVIIILGMLCFCVKILLTMQLKKDWPIFLAFAAFGLLCFWYQNTALVLRIALFLLAGRGKKTEGIVKIFFWGTLLVMLITGVLSAFGLHNTLSLTQAFRHEPETRYCFGFYHPNGFSLFAFKVMMLGLYSYQERLRWWGFGIFAIITFPVIFMADSKTGITACILGFLGMLVIHYWKSEQCTKLLLYVGTVQMFLEVALIVSCMCFFEIEPGTNGGVGVWNIMSMVTSGRLFFVRKVALEVPVPWMGYQGFTEATEVGFVNVMYNQGIVFFILYLIVLGWIYWKMYQKKNQAGMVLILAFTFYCLGEAFIPYMNKNVIWILVMGMFPTVLPMKCRKGEKPNE